MRMRVRLPLHLKRDDLSEGAFLARSNLHTGMSALVRGRGFRHLSVRNGRRTPGDLTRMERMAVGLGIVAVEELVSEDRVRPTNSRSLPDRGPYAYGDLCRPDVKVHVQRMTNWQRTQWQRAGMPLGRTSLRKYHTLKRPGSLRQAHLHTSMPALGRAT